MKGRRFHHSGRHTRAFLLVLRPPQERRMVIPIILAALSFTCAGVHGQGYRVRVASKGAGREIPAQGRQRRRLGRGLQKFSL
jgi:hypothetical protein